MEALRLWPWRPRPERDELLSSWLRRIALGNAPRVHTFCHAIWPRLQIWNRDIDALAPAALMEVLCERTGVRKAAAERTALRAYTGILFDRLRGNTHTDWILPVGVFHRKRRRPGLQWCPRCLSEDREPYYRRRWRLALASTCSTHGIVLADHCHECGSPASPHRGCDPLCDLCAADRRAHPTAQADSQALQFEYRLNELLDPAGPPRTELETMHPLSYYGLIRQVISVLGAGERSQALRDEVAKHWGGDPTPPEDCQLEFMTSAERHRLAGLSARIMRGWPWLFVAHCADAGVWKSWAFGERRYKRSPFAYADPVNRYLTYDAYTDKMV